MNKTSRMMFLQYVELDAHRLDTLGRFGGAKNLRCAARRLRSYLLSIGKKDISFPRLKPFFFGCFEDWLRQQGVLRNTSSSYMRSLHAAFNQAVREGVAANGTAEGLSRLCENPFINVYCGVDKTAKRAVGKNSIRSIQQMDIQVRLTALYKRQGKRITGKYFESALRQLELTRDLFIFSFCMRGMAFVDMAFLRKSDIIDGHVLYARRKTQQWINVRIEPMMQEILERWHTENSYVFPLLTEEHNEAVAYQEYQNQLTLYNRRLKTIGRMLGGINLTSYVSRHSWASAAHAENIPLSIISQSMGHDSELTTRIYLQELDHKVIDNTNGQLLSVVFDGKRNRTSVK